MDYIMPAFVGAAFVALVIFSHAIQDMAKELKRMNDLKQRELNQIAMERTIKTAEPARFPGIDP